MIIELYVLKNIVETRSDWEITPKNGLLELMLIIRMDWII